MGKLRDRRRGGGPTRTISGLNRMGTMQKIMGNKGGVQFPVHGEHDGGRVYEIAADTTATTEDIGRHTGVYLMEADSLNGGDIPTGAVSNYKRVNWTIRGNNLVVWAEGPVACKFWVF